ASMRTGSRGLDASLLGIGVGTILALSAAALSGLLAAIFLPRGPVTTGQALVLLLGALAVGTLGGYLMRSRWALLLLPLAHLVVFEVGRIGAAGPTVDLPRLDSAFGILALLVGRGTYAVIALLPMVAGAGAGLAVARRLAGDQAGWIPSAVMLTLVAALAVWLLLPARTPAIVGPNGEPLAGSIAELATVRLGGAEQAIMLRGNSVENPVLLYLSGGPGQSDLPYSRVLLGDLARDFVVVSWDQRGTGKSYAALEPTASLTLDQA